MLVSASGGYEGYQEIQYPYDGQTNVGIGFYGDEVPNPLEQFNLRVSGFVISYEPPMDFYIDLDTYKVTLTDSQGNNVPLLEEKSPIGTSFFFPTELLKYNEKYTVNVTYEDEFEGKQGSSQWSFTTQKDANSLTYPTPANPFPNPNPSNPVAPPVVEPDEPTSPPVDNPTSYADFRPSAYWADNMLWAIDKGLITGFTNVRNPATGQLENQLRPSDNLTEAQFLAIMWRYIDPERLDGVQPISNYWAAPAYELSERFNLPIKGSVVNRQVADSAITRGEMARILASKHLGRVVSERKAVDFMYSMGLSEGYPDANGNVPRTYESYGVDRLLLREHIVTFMKNYDDYLGSLD
ncbi:S-layer homology domain-containing protein [Alkalihalobacillus oceani]|uniref:S-layer homology domain-containing protein n=1 Tax=Halalkalibacter oceani TaxID=1653776 RepID=A0A9X2DRH8_9BACI|nr:S-layer homology domain-containing protein [Halalkalibacter oceani]MCM3714102.1 S-layer homology domain-containing protein [Halalkalibacter oceani]